MSIQNVHNHFVLITSLWEVAWSKENSTLLFTHIRSQRTFSYRKVALLTVLCVDNITLPALATVRYITTSKSKRKIQTLQDYLLGIIPYLTKETSGFCIKIPYFLYVEHYWLAKLILDKNLLNYWDMMKIFVYFNSRPLNLFYNSLLKKLSHLKSILSLINWLI